ncbi:MAG: hypothetical protein FWC50_10365, partial [Planctomycetaceae bacterium]|nr:hypothetical protein [Planctomycetaceae bacterium]
NNPLPLVAGTCERNNVTRTTGGRRLSPRWQIVELDLNAIKTMMGLDVLRGKTPHKMRLELLVGLLAYNLVRLMMLNSASLAGVSPRAISFTACLSYLASSWNRVHWMPLSVWQSQIEVNLLELAKHRVGHRQGRLEPLSPVRIQSTLS